MFDRISPEEAAARLESGAVLVDVREPDEWNVVHAVGASLIPLSEFANRYSEMPQDKEIILICAGGVRSAQAAQYAAERGYKTTNLEGGTNAWVAAGLPTE
jgi:rhodanese-related sulfurtransferase